MCASVAHMTRRTQFVSVHLTPDARTEIQRAVLAYTAPAGRRLSMSEVVKAAMKVATANPAALMAALDQTETA